MIIDNIAQLSCYSLPYIDHIGRYVKETNMDKLKDGEYELNGRRLFVRVMDYETKDPSEAKFEAHQIYADVQYVVRGAEMIQVVGQDQLEPTMEYDKDGDYQLFDAQKFVTDLIIREGMFAVFFPGQAHKPGCICNEAETNSVKKLVFKIKMS